MNVKTAKKAERRIDTGYVSRFKMQRYGENNLYPQHLADITRASGTAELCLNRYSKFIEGYGFDDYMLANCVVNNGGDTADDVLKLVCDDLARYGGFALHVNYNVLGEVVSVSHVPFEQCRLEEEDDMGNVQHIVLHPDWSGRKTRNGQRISVDERNVKRINVFNPDKTIVMQQIDNVGGIDSYEGQILWCSRDGNTTYPTPIYDAAITEISTDEGLGNIKYRNVRNNFLTACMLISKKGIPRISDDGDSVEQQMITDEDLVQFQGDENTSKILAIELENDEDEPKVVAFPTKNYDKEFSVTDTSVIERIYAQFHQELFYAIRIGKLGFSGQVMQDAYEYYAGEVTNEQRMIERAMRKILDAWYDKQMRNVQTTIQPLKYVSANIVDNNTI